MANRQFVSYFFQKTVGICGLIANICSLAIFFKVQALHNCFGYLLFIHAIGEAGILILYVFWSTPLAIFTTNLSHSLLGIKLGQIMLICWFITIYAQVLKAFNRFIAIASPIYYRSLFNDQNAKLFLGIVVAASGCHGVVYFFESCNFYFDHLTLLWTYEASDCGHFISFYMDFAYCSCLMLIVITTDCFTLVFIHLNRRKLSMSKCQRMRQAKDVRFFIQTCLTSILYSIMIASFHLVWRITSNPWHVFFSTSVAWELCHAMDAALMIAFNSKLRGKKVEFSLPPSGTSSVSRIFPILRIVF